MNLLRIAARVAAGGGTCVYVDLDETLVHTMDLRDDTGAARFGAWPGEKLELAGGGAGTVLRPLARELLEELRAYGPVYMLTHSVGSYAGQIAAAFGLDVDAIFPRESLGGRVGAGEARFVLVDDLDPLHPVVQMKMAAAGVPPYQDLEPSEEGARAHFSAWQVRPPEFLGSPEDRGLEGIAALVGSALALQDRSASLSI